MTFAEYSEKLEYCLKEQIEAFAWFYKTEEEIRECVVAKDWEKLEKKLNFIKKQACSMEKTETERNAIYKAMQKKAGNVDNPDDFCAFMDRYCPDKSSVMNYLYKELRLNVVKVKALNARLDAYLSTVTSAVSMILDEAFPIRKGTIYNSSGAKGSAISPPLVLDKQL
jgi:hypothetical protein